MNMRSILIVVCITLVACGIEKKENTVSPVSDSLAVVAPVTNLDSAIQHASQHLDSLLSSETIGGIHVGQSESEVNAILGRPLQRSVAQVWEADGNFHQDWEYKDLVLDMSGADSVKLTVSGIYISTPCSLKTLRKIGIGSSYKEVKKAYLEFFNKEESNDSILVAGSVYGGIIFNFANGKVNRIFMGAAAE